MTKNFDDMTEDEQDQVARAKIKEILSKPELENGDAATVAACVAFIGTSQKMADKFSQALLDTAESYIQGLCVRCGETPGAGSPDCFICQGIRNVQALKLDKENKPEEMRIPIHKTDGTHVGDLTEEGIIEEPRAPEPLETWTHKELEALRVNAHLQPSAIAKYVNTLKRRTKEEIKAKLKEL